MSRISKNLSIHDKVIPTNLFNVITSVLNCLDINISDLVVGTDLTVAELGDPYALVSFQQCCDVIKNGQQISENPALGLTLAHQGGFSAWGVAGSALISCENLKDAFSVAMELCPTGWIIPFLDEDKDLTSLQIHTAHAAGSALPCILEEAFGCILWLARALVGAGLTPRQLQLSYRPPVYAGKYQQLFQCPVLFNQPCNRLVLDTELLYKTNPNYNRASRQIGLELCRQVLSKQNIPQSFPYQVRSLLIKHIEGFPSMAQVAEELGMTERTLRRNLADSEIGFQMIIDDIRKEIAIEQLQTTDMSIKDIAYLVGMGDAGNFSRDFKKWTGKIPGEFRRSLNNIGI